MIPNFALLLSEEGITLLHRVDGSGGWTVVDEISLDMPDLPTGLRQLCDTAHRLSDGAFTTKILLPKSQLLYAEITVSDDVDGNIRSALEDRTPYTADQLQYDSSGTGNARQVVAVARETLEEATGFISQFGFNPIGFSTIPPDGTFDGEPNLGDFQNATFVPDAQAVTIVETPEVAEAAPVIETAPEPSPDTAPIPEPDTEDDAPIEVQEATPDEPAAFSSRRNSTQADADRVSERLTKRAPRIAIPDKTAKPTAPKVAAPQPAPSAVRPVPAIVPAASPKPAARVSPIARLKREKAAPSVETSTVHDPLAALAAKQNQGKPRYLGVMLSLGLLMALGLFAVLSSYLLPEGTVSSWFQGDQETTVEMVDFDDEAASDLEDFSISSLPDDANLPSAVPDLDDTPIDQDIPDVADTPQAPADPSGPLDETNAQTAYAVTGIWQRAPDFGALSNPDSLDDLYVASLDPDPAFEDAPALPAQTQTPGDNRQAAPIAPPPPGVRYDLDDRGLIRPTANGALSPEGVYVFLGRPPIPPVRRDDTAVPDDLAPAILDETEFAEPVEPAVPVQPTQTGPFADPALAALKPRQRPSDLAERIERAQLGGNTRAELARFKPDQRPQAIVDQAQQAARAREDAAKAQAEAIAAALAEAEESAAEQERAASLVPLDEDTAATALAVAISRKPPARPRGFDKLVNTARQAQTAGAVRGTGPAVVRSSRGRPSGPTAGAVARAATDNNAIALGKVALVGVFGTSSSRRALVRLPSGRFKKVSVGDRVDGGRVAAIGSSELKYTKSGRTLTLKMPQS